MFPREKHSNGFQTRPPSFCPRSLQPQVETDGPNLLLSSKKPSVLGWGEEQPPSRGIPLWCSQWDFGHLLMQRSGGEVVKKGYRGKFSCPSYGYKGGRVTNFPGKPLLVSPSATVPFSVGGLS